MIFYKLKQFIKTQDSEISYNNKIFLISCTKYKKNVCIICYKMILICKQLSAKFVLILTGYACKEISKIQYSDQILCSAVFHGRLLSLPQYH